MKVFKKIIIIFTLLFCLLPINSIKADDKDIMLTEAAYICSKCGNTFVNVQKIYTTDWYVYEMDFCPDHTYGYDVGYARNYIKRGSCTNCSHTIYEEDCVEYRGVCEGYD